MTPWRSIMEDNAPSHAVVNTMEEMIQRLIQPRFPLANSSDPNPMEGVWNRMKDYIQLPHWIREAESSELQIVFRSIVKETWNPMSSEDLARLIESIPTRCQAVLDADGESTRY
ncbi:Bgt-51835 [Blumeria graminis f. sp. tritici]|uniref:Bgt-51835 n=1 Tax=Blumeria graminis f. sp. tritici TaxID=62690 RepID=A0A9X9L8Y4_BLUGR|nr:Bgt-51835 [Blumeria graminis f. sp. tritici]